MGKSRKLAAVTAIALAGALTAVGLGAEDAATNGIGKRAPAGNGIAVDMGLTEAAGDLGARAAITMPWILDGHATARITGLVLCRNTTWKPYAAVRAGLVGASFMSSADIRLYGEGGAILLFPSSASDSSAFAVGGYGHFGMEFFLARDQNGLAYYIELGTNGIGARPDKEPGSPVYCNGFATSVGLRWYP